MCYKYFIHMRVRISLYLSLCAVRTNVFDHKSTIAGYLAECRPAAADHSTRATTLSFDRAAARVSCLNPVDAPLPFRWCIFGSFGAPKNVSRGFLGDYYVGSSPAVAGITCLRPV